MIKQQNTKIKGKYLKWKTLALYFKILIKFRTVFLKKEIPLCSIVCSFLFTFKAVLKLRRKKIPYVLLKLAFIKVNEI